MLVKTKDLKEIGELLIELSESGNEYINLKNSFKLNIVKEFSVPRKFCFKASNESESNVLKNYLNLFHNSNYSGSDWERNPQRYYLHISEGNYIRGSVDIEDSFEEIDFKTFEKYTSLRRARLEVKYL